MMTKTMHMKKHLATTHEIYKAPHSNTETKYTKNASSSAHRGIKNDT
jgi:hypothetical protein